MLSNADTYIIGIDQVGCVTKRMDVVFLLIIKAQSQGRREGEIVHVCMGV
jgi:hypothetical protein